MAGGKWRVGSCLLQSSGHTDFLQPVEYLRPRTNTVVMTAVQWQECGARNCLHEGHALFRRDDLIACAMHDEKRTVKAAKRLQVVEWITYQKPRNEKPRRQGSNTREC